MSERKSQDMGDKIWYFLASMTFAIGIFGVISVTSIIGTLIPQNAESEITIGAISEFVGSSFAPTAYEIVDAMGLTSMYNSWWFVSLIGMFAVSLIVCSIERLPRIWKLAKKPLKPLSVEAFNGMSIKREITLNKKLKGSEVRDVVSTTLKEIGFKRILKSEDGLQFYAEKGKYSRFGVYITHFSIILILMGALIGMFFGYLASVSILEGTSTEVVFSRADGSEIPLPFEIKVHDFHTDFWGETDRPKEFTSWVTIYEDGKPVEGYENFVLQVNRPLRHRGIIIYQASYGYFPNDDALFKFNIISNDGKKKNTAVKFNESFPIPGVDMVAIVADFSPALGIGEDGKFFTYTDNMHNPAALVQFFDKDDYLRWSQWFLMRYPDTWSTPFVTMEFLDLWGAQWTGFQVRKDPGVWLVYLGCIVMSIGFYMSFFMSHRRIWGRFTDDGNCSKIIIAASANKGREPYKQKIDKVIKEVIEHG